LAKAAINQTEETHRKEL